MRAVGEEEGDLYSRKAASWRDAPSGRKRQRTSNDFTAPRRFASENSFFRYRFKLQIFSMPKDFTHKFDIVLADHAKNPMPYTAELG